MPVLGRNQMQIKLGNLLCCFSFCCCQQVNLKRKILGKKRKKIILNEFVMFLCLMCVYVFPLLLLCFFLFSFLHEFTIENRKGLKKNTLTNMVG